MPSCGDRAENTRLLDKNAAVREKRALVVGFILSVHRLRIEEPMQIMGKWTSMHASNPRRDERRVHPHGN